MEVVIKPRTNFTSSALRRAVPQTDIKKKRESLTMSMINIYQSGSQRLFKSGKVETQSNRQLQSCNLVAKQISFASPRGMEIQKAVRKSSQQLKKQPAQIDDVVDEQSDDDSSAKSDATSESNSSSDESIDAAINGEDDTEQALYERILAEQEGREIGEERKSSNDLQLEDLVDKNMINLLIFCTMLTKPPAADIEARKVTLGPQVCSKLLILDMDETLLHSRFHKITSAEEAFETGIQSDANGVLEFNILISSRTNAPPSTRINVKLRQHLEEALQYLGQMYELCVFTAGEQDYADAILDFIDPDRSLIKHRLYR